jgi:hypothetical protein
MRCKLCTNTTHTSTGMKKHCWASNQLCDECHYLGSKNMRTVKLI